MCLLKIRQELQKWLCMERLGWERCNISSRRIWVRAQRIGTRWRLFWSVFSLYHSLTVKFIESPNISEANLTFLVYAERLQQLQLSNRQLVQDPNFQSRPKPLVPPNRRRELEEAENPNNKYSDPAAADYDEEEEEEYEDEEKTSYTSSTTPHSRCSRGVSTDELEEDQPPLTHKSSSETLNHSSSSLSNKSIQSNNGTSKRFEDGDRVVISESAAAPSRNSVLLQLIACGSSAVAKAKNSPCVKQPVYSSSESRNLHKVVLCKRAVRLAEEEDMINFMSENPRFGNLQAQEKEYFSGSIVESITTDDRVAAEPVLKKSNSYNEER